MNGKYTDWQNRRWQGESGRWPEYRRYLAIALPFFLGVLSLLVAGLVSATISTSLAFSPVIQDRDVLLSYRQGGLAIYDRTGRLLFSEGGTRWDEYVELSRIPDIVQEATLAVEDAGFYYHRGISLKGIARALVTNVSAGDLYQQGGSTISQQLVRILLLSPEKSIHRKFQEIILARQLEQHYTKDEILEMYLNSVYFGRGSYGISEAAREYFGKTVEELSLPEAAYLAGLPRAPSLFATDSTLATNRYRYSLSRLAAEGKISEAQATEGSPPEILPYTPQVDIKAPHFVFYVRDLLVAEYGEEVVAQSGFRVTTTLDLTKQKQAEDILRRGVDRLRGRRVTNGGLVALDVKEGTILSMVGSRDFFDTKNNGQFNVVTGLRSPGSAFKPIVYLAALEKGLTAATVLSDVPTSWGKYSPRNFDGNFRGPVLVRRALANSLNIPAVQVLNSIGINSALDEAARLGLTTLEARDRYGLSLVLGGGGTQLLEMTNAYATLARQGTYLPPAAIQKITNKQGQVIYERVSEGKQVVDPRAAYIVTSILSDNEARKEIFGSRNPLELDRPAAVKTGTGQDFRDAVTIGYTPSVAIGAWIGNNNYAIAMDAVAGALGPAPIWREAIQLFVTNQAPEFFSEPAGLVRARICKSNGLLAPHIRGSGTYEEVFIEGTVPTGICRLIIEEPAEDEESTDKEPVDESGRRERKKEGD